MTIKERQAAIVRDEVNFGALIARGTLITSFEHAIGWPATFLNSKVCRCK
jgi:hypothetical protein